MQVRVGVISMEQNRGHAARTHEFLLGLGLDGDAIRFDRMRDVGRGNPMPPEAVDERHARAGGAERPSTWDFGGSAAVAYDGSVYPCIFSRHLPLGSIRDASLKTILTSALPIAPRTRRLPVASSRLQEKLACWQCQARSALLEGNLDA
jgi:MoaA/NifB/PqqE/SkfB family radical SAM enzyme